jgi:hypothetical protein
MVVKNKVSEHPRHEAIWIGMSTSNRLFMQHSLQQIKSDTLEWNIATNNIFSFEKYVPGSHRQEPPTAT